MLITEEYRKLNKELHKTREDYGTSSGAIAGLVKDLINKYEFETVLDYGCGKGLLKKAIGPIITEYDPAISGKDNPPSPAELVICSDVLEHIEPECIDDVLGDLERVTQDFLFALIATGPAKKVLSDGRNAHLIQEGLPWWINKMEGHFHIQLIDTSLKGKIILFLRHKGYKIP